MRLFGPNLSLIIALADIVIIKSGASFRRSTVYIAWHYCVHFGITTSEAHCDTCIHTQAKANELELSKHWAQAAASRRQSQMKYGFWTLNIEVMHVSRLFCSQTSCTSTTADSDKIILNSTILVAVQLLLNYSLLTCIIFEKWMHDYVYIRYNIEDRLYFTLLSQSWPCLRQSITCQHLFERNREEAWS